MVSFIVGIFSFLSGILITWVIINKQKANLKIELESEKAKNKAAFEFNEKHLKALQEREVNLKQEYEKRLAVSKNEALEQRKAELETLQQSYRTQMELFKQQVTNTTEKMLKERSETLQNTNSRQMETLFKPIKENILEMQKSLNDNREANAKHSATFSEAIKNMMERTAALGETADRLSNALQQKNKIAGNWGEMVLNRLLESYGLVKGVHFDVQETLCDANGKTIKNEDTESRMIPDVILHLADNRDVIIDSKVSLAAFVDYQNAKTEEERNDAVVRHLKSIKNHVKELKTKKYQDYIRKPKVSANFVIMFVPHEGAIQLAMAEDPALWQNAFDEKVFIANSQTLLAALRIIDLTWINVRQNENTEKVMEQAKNLVDRVSSFMNRFNEFGSAIHKLQEKYDDVNTIVAGKKSILTSGQKLEQLGVKGKASLGKLKEETE